jgi:hypothetical protein
MSAAIDARLAEVDVTAVLNYLHPTPARPVDYTFDPPTGLSRHSGPIDARTVLIRNARRYPDLSLDTSGFGLVFHRSTLQDFASFQDSERVKAIDYPEVEATLKARTGAQKVIIFDHTLRDSTAEPGRAALREPVRRVHDDQTFKSAPQRVMRHLSGEEAAWRLGRRYAIVNFWRPIEAPVARVPLAVCDARSLSLTDLVPSDLVYPDWTGETYSVTFNPRHRWYWYPRQNPAEATLLKIFDSATDGRARMTAHTAFDDPSTPADAPPRRSIEIRSILFW